MRNQVMSVTGHKTRKRSKSVRELYHMDLFEKLPKDAIFGMPIIESFQGTIPTKLVPFNIAMAERDYNCTVHFYINDGLFMQILRRPLKYLDILHRFDSVIAPDFSQYMDFPYPLRIYNSFQNKAFAAFLQHNGVDVISNVTWSDPASYAYSFAGLPKNSVVAINCNGIKKHDFSSYLWSKGYQTALATLQPKLIIRYGTKMPDEREDISMYFSNERLMRLKYGR